MNKQQADELITVYLPKIYGFAINKAFSYDEAEELCSDIVAEVYISFLSSNEIYNVDGYVWRISQHVYSKFVSSKKKREGISIDGVDIPDYTPIFDESPEEEIDLLRREIAFLTQIRRQIIYSFYYENKSISAISKEIDIPEGTVKWHLNKGRNELKEGFTMERKIGRLGLKPIEARNFGHGGNPGKNGGPEYYLSDKLNLNIVYSAYHEPKTVVEIAEELGVTPVFIEDKVKMLENNGFLVMQSGKKYTTYVHFNPETYSLEQQDKKLQKQMEIAHILAREYVPKVRASVSGVNDVYIPSGNRELFEAAVIFNAICNKCNIDLKTDLSKYRIKTLDGGDYYAFVNIYSTQIDTDYSMSREYPSYWACGEMIRESEKYDIVSSWSVDTAYCSRKGSWKNNLTTDYEYLYEFIIGAIEDTPANKEKFSRLRERDFLTVDNKVNIMVFKGDYKKLFSLSPSLEEDTKKLFVSFALEQASQLAKNYPPQMQDMVISTYVGEFAKSTVALMVMDILYGTGTFRHLTDEEKVTSNLLMFCDRLPE